MKQMPVAPVHVRIPLSAPKQSKGAPDASGRRVLIVEDEPVTEILTLGVR